MITNVLCPSCNAPCAIESADAGQTVNCQQCGGEFTPLIAAETAAPFQTAVDDEAAKTVASPSGLVGQTLGGCRIERKLGQGGMGIVFKGHHEALDIPVAVKVLAQQFAEDRPAVERFVREARAAARLKHPNIVGVLNVGEEEGQHFIIMDYVEGQSLQAILNATGFMATGKALDIIRQMAEALKIAHKNRIVHRDIKPDNILMDQEGVAKLADLGLAKRTEGEAQLTQAGAALGTPYYISPEQVMDARSADHRSDMYSLGCTLFHMVCGKVPYQGSSFYEILDKHLHAAVPDPKDANPDVPDAIAALIRRMMAKDPDERYQTPEALLGDLDKAMAGTLSTAAGRPSRLAVWLASGAALVLIAWGAAFLVWPGRPQPSSSAASNPPLPREPELPEENAAASAPAVERPALQAYRAAQAAEGRREFQAAARQYFEMAEAHSKDDLADDALLRSGKLLLAQLEKPKTALKTFRLLLDRYPQTEVSDEVLYLTAVAVEKLSGPGAKAIAAYGRVAEAIPDTEFGRRAQERLQELRQE